MMIIVVIITVVTITTIMTVSIVMVADGCASALGAAFKLSLQCCVGWHCLSSFIILWLLIFLYYLLKCTFISNKFFSDDVPFAVEFPKCNVDEESGSCSCSWVYGGSEAV